MGVANLAAQWLSISELATPCDYFPATRVLTLPRSKRGPPLSVPAQTPQLPPRSSGVVAAPLPCHISAVWIDLF
jgi:hypothetical protein